MLKFYKDLFEYRIQKFIYTIRAAIFLYKAQNVTERPLDLNFIVRILFIPR